MDDLVIQFKTARRCGVPIIAIRTPDQEASCANLRSGLSAPMLTWDMVRGAQPGNSQGAEVILNLERSLPADPLTGERMSLQTITKNASEMLDLASNLPEQTALFMYNAHRIIDAPIIAQGIANLRTPYSQSFRTLILLCPEITLPAQIANDVLIMDEPLPTGEQLAAIIGNVHKGAEIAEPNGEFLAKQVEALVGLSAFTSEQSAAMSLTREGMNLEALWNRKKQMIENSRGLYIWRGNENFAGLGGLSNIKSHLTAMMGGREAPMCVLFIDEGEKMFAGATGPVGDNTGVAQDFLGQFLSWTQNREAMGLIAYGPPGTGKSQLAKSFGGTFGMPVITLDLGGMKTSELGGSEAYIRAAFKIIDAVSGGRICMILTCNRAATLPPELLRRFPDGSFFFDFPDTEEQAAIWNIYRPANEIPEDDPLPDCRLWTGAEIKQCCKSAWRKRTTLREAARYIAPVAITKRAEMEALRRSAHNTYISASRDGMYQFCETPPSSTLASSQEAKIAAARRRIAWEDTSEE